MAEKRHRKTGEEIIDVIRRLIHQIEFMFKHRMAQKDFTRKRKLPFISLIVFMLNLIKQSLQKELTDFFTLFSKGEKITKSAFCQSRMKLKHTAFIELNDAFLHEFYTDNIIETWNKFRLLATDGTTVQLPESKELIDEFGCATNQSETGLPMARASSCYDVLNSIVANTQISPYNTSEYTLALRHLENIQQGEYSDLFLYDRGYCAIWFMFYHILQRKDFVVRVQHNFISEINPFWESDENSKIVNVEQCSEKSLTALQQLGLKFEPFKLRFVKVILDNGEVEILATSLFDEEKYPVSEFKELYNKRWGVEINYDHLKNHLQLEDFTGMSVLSVKQDFFANAFILNLQAIIARDAQDELDKEHKGREYRYKVNKNLSLGFLKDKVVEILMGEKGNSTEQLKQLFKLEPTPIRNGRKFPRQHDKKRRRKYHMNKKRAI